MAGSNTINFADTIAQWITKSNNMDSDIGIRTNLTTTDKTDFVAAINEIKGTQADLMDSARIKAMFSDTTTINFDSAALQHSLQDSCITAKHFKNHVKIDIKNSSGTVLARLWSPDSPGG